METETMIREPLEAEYDALHAALIKAHHPANAHEQVLVEEFIDACWDLKAARRVDREFWCFVGGHYNRGQAGVPEAQFHEKEARFRTHLRHRANCEQAGTRVLRGNLNWRGDLDTMRSDS